MKVKCIDNNGAKGYLTVGKIYEVLAEEGVYYRAEDDTGLKNCSFFKTRFEIAEEEFTLTVDNAYKGWEILKMIDEEVLKKGDRYKRLNSTYTVSTFTVGEGSFPSVDSLLNDKFVLIKKEYMTFFEAKEKGTPKHKEYGYGIVRGMPGTLEATKELIKEMDKKVWYVKEID